MATIYVVRHGQASFGAANYDQLSKLGCRQAEVLGHYFRDCDIQFDAVYSGDLQRQQKTAQLAISSQATMPEHHIDSRFNEIQNDEQIQYLLPEIIKSQPSIKALVDSGAKDSKSFQKMVEASFNFWVSEQCRDERIQSWTDYSSGVRAAMQDAMAANGSGKTIGIFASGGTIATIVAQVLGLGGEHTYRFYEPVINCSVSQLFYSQGGRKVSLSYFNDHSFLDVLGRQMNESLVTYR
ncbi:MAG: histidine phosphatase family protein [Pseudomonadales bacterium]